MTFFSLLVLAQLTTGGPVSVTPPAGVAPVRWPDVAYSTTGDVFLAVSGADDLQGHYFSATGAALGTAFKVNAADVFGQAPRVTYSARHDAFLVTWHETLGSDTRIRGRIIRYGQPALTADFDISDFGTNWEMGATVAYSETSDEYLVGWQGRATTHIKVQRVSGTGALLGTSITVETVPYARDPSIASPERWARCSPSARSLRTTRTTSPGIRSPTPSWWSRMAAPRRISRSSSARRARSSTRQASRSECPRATATSTHGWPRARAALTGWE